MANFDKVREAVETAKAITWDTCHKIYVLMDDNQIELMRSYDYDPILTADDLSDEAMLDKLEEWYSESCGLRLIDAVATDPNNPEETLFTTLISQDF
jgi:hypothetical protein